LAHELQRAVRRRGRQVQGRQQRRLGIVGGKQSGMKESTLAGFFAGETPVERLSRDLVDVVETDTLRSGRNLILDLANDFEVTPVHLVRLCDAFLSGGLD